jgi:hypothetical protein
MAFLSFTSLTDRTGDAFCGIACDRLPPLFPEHPAVMKISRINPHNLELNAIAGLLSLITL